MTEQMHPTEVPITETLVRKLIGTQFPQWSDLPLRRAQPDGTVHAIFRLGDELSVRVPRVDGSESSESKELEWLPRLAPRLPVEIPVPVGQGHPTDDYPWFWEIHTWVDGEMLPIDEIDAVQAARDLAAVVANLQGLDPVGAPRGRGVDLAERDAFFREWLPKFTENPIVEALWERALRVPPWDGPPVWHHGDLDMRNWLVRDGRVTGVIDWGEMGVGDPAVDVMVAWKLHSPEARDAFREALPIDDATWDRARGWIISQAVPILAYYTPQNNPVLVHEAEKWLELVYSESR
jgi:aminoglycoside phosphotransferase (APT) family kinase protein